MITARPAFIPFLGRRWRTYCTRCHVDLPGRYTDRRDALAAGDDHLALRHVGVRVG